MLNNFHGRPALRLDPVITPIVVGLSLAATGVSVHQQQKAARETKRAGRRQAGELRRAAEAERERSRRLRGRQRAAFGAAGVNPDVGSPLQVQLRSIMDSIDEQDRILRGAANVQKDARARANALRIGSYATAIGGLSSTLNYASNRGVFDPDGNTSSTPSPQITPGHTNFSLF